MVGAAGENTALKPESLKDAPALIERVFPAQKVSAEAQKERKAVQSQTLTGLGSYWKGRKPLMMVRSLVLASLLPVSDDLQADLDIFEKLMAMDDGAFGRREPKMSAADVAAKVTLNNPWDLFDFTIIGGDLDEENVQDLAFPIDPAEYPELRIRWKRGLDADAKASMLAQALADMPYEDKVGMTKRPEEVNPNTLYGPIWSEVNAHLASFGIEAHSHEELVQQLGILRYGHRPRVGDTFCGGGSIPFEAARLGCDAFASDLNPIACMLTWGAFSIVGAGDAKRAEIEREKRRVTDTVDAEITALGIEHNERGDRAKAYLYCLEVRCPETGWMVPLAPSWVISKSRNVIAQLVPNYKKKSFDIEVVMGVSKVEMQAAEKGTARDGKLDYELDGKRYTTPISTLRGDYRDEHGVNHNRLRQWEKHDFMPREDDLFQERLYAIQWIKVETLNKSRPETYFVSVTEGDMERERKVERVVWKNLANWQAQGLMPDMLIEPGDKTNEPIRTRGWRYWHQLFNPRSLLTLATAKKRILDSPASPYLLVGFAKQLDWLNKGCYFGTGAARESISHMFSNQALNTLLNYGCRSSFSCYPIWSLPPGVKSPIKGVYEVETLSSEDVNEECDLWITDPPYADAVNYHEITEFFIAWLRKNPPAPFNEWKWDSRRSMAIQGSGKEFRHSMIDAYTTMANHMPDNGLQCVMFTHQDTSVWGDMISIFWASGLQVVGAWYIATEASTALRSGAHVQGTVTLILRKRQQDAGQAFKRQLLPKIRIEVESQIGHMMRLNEEAQSHGNTVFSDADLQMAGYAAALKVLTAYSKIDGKDVGSFALQPRERCKKNVVDEIVAYASEIANNALIPEVLKAIDEETWTGLTPTERFYSRLLAVEKDGQFKLDNYQNFGKAFKVNYAPLMASTAANQAHLKGAQDFRASELMNGPLAQTATGFLLLAIRELLDDTDPQAVHANLRSEMGALYMPQRRNLIAVAQYLAVMLAERRPVEAEKAEVLANRISNESW